jgi:hypothetical protein
MLEGSGRRTEDLPVRSWSALGRVLLSSRVRPRVHPTFSPVRRRVRLGKGLILQMARLRRRVTIKVSQEPMAQPAGPDSSSDTAASRAAGRGGHSEGLRSSINPLGRSPPPATVSPTPCSRIREKEESPVPQEGVPRARRHYGQRRFVSRDGRAQAAFTDRSTCRARLLDCPGAQGSGLRDGSSKGDVRRGIQHPASPPDRSVGVRTKSRFHPRARKGGSPARRSFSRAGMGWAQLVRYCLAGSPSTT